VHRLVSAVKEHMAVDGVIKGAGGGDGGLFGGILARYLALVVTTLPQTADEDAIARDTARSLVLKSAQSAWDYRQTVDGLPLFGPFWDRSAEIPTAAGKEAQFVEGAVNASEVPERDLSVQLSGWMLMEAAHVVAAATGETASAE
jgi:predicted alpha-1,6-mannanase (GH76 family)